MLGTLGVSLVSGLTGARFDPTLGEYMVLPAKTVRSLARNPQFGVVPLVPLVQASVPRLEMFSSLASLERSDGSHTTRWTRGQLWHKALLLLLANPWAMLPRVALAIALTVAVLGSYGMAVGIASLVIHGTFLGVGSVLIAIVLVFSVLACLQLVTLGLVVVLFRSAPHGAPGASSDVEILDLELPTVNDREPSISSRSNSRRLLHPALRGRARIRTPSVTLHPSCTDGVPAEIARPQRSRLLSLSSWGLGASSTIPTSCTAVSATWRPTSECPSRTPPTSPSGLGKVRLASSSW